VIDKKNAFEMVDLVLQTGCQQSLGFERLQPAVAVEKLGAHLRRPLDLFPDIGHRETALFAQAGFFGCPENLRIHEHARLVLPVFPRQVHHQDALRHADLYGSKTDAVIGVHALEHLVDKPANPGVDRADRLRDDLEARVGRGKDGARSHESEIGERRNEGKVMQATGTLTILIVLIGAVLAVGGALALAWAASRRKTSDELAGLAPRLEALAIAQNEIAGRFAQALAGQTELQTVLAGRLDALDRRLGDSLKETASRTAETLGGIQTRLSVIDEAQKNITALSGQVVNLQEILANKQARGAFGQQQMEAIVADALPPALYAFQAQLSNGSRPDCLIRVPNADAAIVVDSKFPLESFAALRAAEEDERKAALAAVRGAVLKHVKDIAEKYLLPGETQTPAIMFVPSESIYADLHEFCPDVIQRALREQVVVVSPSILMLAVMTIQTVLKDARMREQANLIQKEVGLLLQDTRRLAERVSALQRHFSQGETDIKDIAVSTEKIIKRAGAIEAVELSPAAVPQLAAGE
jgi:DNA recombination protein RmuC